MEEVVQEAMDVEAEITEVDLEVVLEADLVEDITEEGDVLEGVAASRHQSVILQNTVQSRQKVVNQAPYQFLIGGFPLSP
ncbi:hypothetical protein Pcinc_005218 [Petrolisthes cinctipes]|uniref:Uncharacterized protein n=1 Tax=Petrolisthes cinctipes TaxID=88211 RepID=A0AAE1L0D2_PETCI|nr:hypothetical protein Pcinc_005218 [Petrolisthes cinctipes]